jgi:hypothetical protein
MISESMKWRPRVVWKLQNSSISITGVAVISVTTATKIGMVETSASQQEIHEGKPSLYLFG